MRVLMLGATGTIGRATTHALLRAGHEVVCFLRASGKGGNVDKYALAQDFAGALLRWGDVCDSTSLQRDGFCNERFDAVVSCLASRSGAPADAWAIDHGAHMAVLDAAQAAGVRQMVLLSAICVQKPQLEFQRAKLAFETALMQSKLTWSIVRPTAFFKSLSGQVDRVRAGKPFLVFGDGRLTACKPIGDEDLAQYIADCLIDVQRHDRVLPIGGPGPAITPLEQGQLLFDLSGRAPRFRHVPPALLDAVIALLTVLGVLWPALRNKAELARIGRYYARESMLVLDTDGRYSADATPSTGTRTLADHYADMLAGRVQVHRGDHAVF